jgi:tRNA pseudouridine55 synthase
VPEKDGVLLIDKPEGPSSRDVLDALEDRLRIGPLGHSGTLDPLASGLLVVLAGRARKLQSFFTGRDKRYRAVVRFGATSETLDRESEERRTGAPPPSLEPAARDVLLASKLGETPQRPPAYSAVRIAGRRAHELARGGRPVEPAPRLVRFSAIDFVSADGADWTLDVACSAGAFIRSLARDLGESAGCGAYLVGLRRVASGTSRVEDAVAPEKASPDDVRPLDFALRNDVRFDLDPAAVALLRNGAATPAPAAVFERPDAAFGWYRDRPRFKLKALTPPLVRSEFMIEEPDA